MPKSALVHVMTITLNVMPRPGVKITDTILRPVPCRPLLTANVRTENLIIKDVKKTGRELVVKAVMSTLVLRDGFMQPPTAARGILLMVNAVPHRPLPVVRPITALPVPVLPPVPMPVVTPVTVVVPIPVLPVLKTIPAPWPDIPNAVRLVTDVKTVLPAALLIPEIMQGRLNAELVTIVLIPAAREQKVLPVAAPVMNLIV